jgi:hypothetical protein
MKTRWQIEDERDKRAQEEWRARQERLATLAAAASKPSSTSIDARYEATLAVDFEDDGDSDRETK